MWTYSSQPQSISAIIRDSFALYKASFSKVWYWHIIWFLPMTVLSIITPYVRESLPSYALWIATAIMAIIYLFGELFLLHRINAIAEHGDGETRGSLQMAMKKIPNVLLLYFFTILFIGLTMFFIVSLPLVTFASINELPGTARFMLALQFPVMIGLVLILAYYFWFMAFIIMIMIVNDNYRLFFAIKKSFTWIVNNWWRSFFAIMLGSAFLFVVAKIFANISQYLTGSNVVAVLATLLAYTLFHSVFNSVLLVQYHDLKLRNEQKTTAVNDAEILSN